MTYQVKFNVPYLTGNELVYVREAMSAGYLSGHGPFAHKCEDYLSALTGAPASFLTPSCSAALEMAMILADIKPGDEVIMPSFTFVSTANAVVLRGGRPVFVDIRADTLNLDESLVEAAISSRTRAIIVVHYGGVAADTSKLRSIARDYELLLVEDAAHCVHASNGSRELGSIGDLATFSFHETKNVQCGEGGALIVNNEELLSRAEIIQDKGTNRSEFLRNESDKYTWMDVGSSFLPSEITSAFLYAQLQESASITDMRLKVWNSYAEMLSERSESSSFSLASIPEGFSHNGHLFYILLAKPELRDSFLQGMARKGIQCTFHYVPLHSSPFGKGAGRVHGGLTVTNLVASSLVRLPISPDLSEAQTVSVIEAIESTFRELEES